MALHWAPTWVWDKRCLKIPDQNKQSPRAGSPEVSVPLRGSVSGVWLTVCGWHVLAWNLHGVAIDLLLVAHRHLQIPIKSFISFTKTVDIMADTKGSFVVKAGLAKMLKGGVIMDVINVEQAKIAEAAGAVAVMALERIPADIRFDGGVARMSDPAMINEIRAAVTIPVMAKVKFRTPNNTELKT